MAIRPQQLHARKSTRDAALVRPSDHSFVPGMGYVEHPKPPVPVTGSSIECLPASGTEDGTSHFLTSPCGNSQVKFTWNAADKSWSNGHGSRMAFTAQYLSGHGWSYHSVDK